MGPVLAAAAFGFLKGMSTHADVKLGGQQHWMMHSLMGPIFEETMFRALPLRRKSNLPVGWTGVPFAFEHVAQESARGAHTSMAGLFGRFAEVFLGGVLYEKAFRQWGLGGAVLAHVAHNAAMFAGQHARRRVRRRP